MQTNTWRVGRPPASLLLALLLGVAMCLVACAPAKQESQSTLQEQQRESDAEVIRQGISSELEALTHPTQELLEAHLGASDAEALATIEQFGIDYQELVQHLLGKMSYRIDGITVDGDHAQATLTITNVDIDAALGGLEASINTPEGLEEFAAHYNAQDDSALMQAVLRHAYECIDACQEMASTSVELTLSKQDNVWRVDDSCTQAFVGALYGDFDFETLGIAV